MIFLEIGKPYASFQGTYCVGLLVDINLRIHSSFHPNIRKNVWWARFHSCYWACNLRRQRFRCHTIRWGRFWSFHFLSLSSAKHTGMLVYMVFQTWYLMKGLKTESPAKKKFYICYGFIQLFLITVETCTNRITGQFMWIDHRDFPGGPFAYYLSVTNAWYSVWDLVCGVISNAMNDGLLVSISESGTFLLFWCQWPSAIPVLCYLEWEKVYHGTTGPSISSRNR